MGIKKNFAFSTVLTASNYIFPFIIYPYVARVLGVNNVGICNFVDGVVNYAVMLSMMGINIVGVREVAKAKGNRRRLDETFTSLLVLCTIFTVIATAALVTATYTMEQFKPYRPLLHIGVLKLWSTFLLIDWLYRGLEDFRYITIRTICVKTGYLVSVFLFVHSPSDYVTYYLLLCMMVTVNAVFNCWHARGIVSLRYDRDTTRQALRPFLILGLYLFLNSMYTTLNVVYLGMKWDDTQVGYYTTATKVFLVILAVYTAYSGVVMPRASSLLSENRIDEFKSLIGKSIHALMLVAVPVSIFGMLYSEGIIYVMCGDGYGGAVLPMSIVMPLVFIIGYEQILVVQTLTPLSSDRRMLILSLAGATVGVIGNVLLVGRYAAVGSAVVWVLAEITVLSFGQYYVSQMVGINFPVKDLAKNVIAYVPYALVSAAILIWAPVSSVGKMIAGAMLCAVYLIVVQRYVLHNPIFMHYYTKMLRRQ